MTDAEAIIEAAQQGDAEKVRGILDRDPTFSNAESPQGWTALHLAGYFGKVAAIFKLSGAPPLETFFANERGFRAIGICA